MYSAKLKIDIPSVVLPLSKSSHNVIEKGGGFINIGAIETIISNSLLVSSVSFTKPTPVPLSSTTVVKTNVLGVVVGIVRVINPGSSSPIGIIAAVWACPTKMPSA